MKFNKMNLGFVGGTFVFLGVLGVLALFFWIELLLWNAIMPSLGVATLSYWEIVGLDLLITMLTFRPQKIN